MPERIPPPPPTQALNTTTFTPPPLDLSLTLAGLIDFHRAHSPNHVVYVYEDAPAERKQITFSTWIRAIHRAGRHVRDLFQLPEPQVGSAKPVISMLANSGEKIPRHFTHFPALTHKYFDVRHDHIRHREARDRPGRRCRFLSLTSEFCSRCRPPYREDGKQVHHRHIGPQAACRCGGLRPEGTGV